MFKGRQEKISRIGRWGAAAVLSILSIAAAAPSWAADGQPTVNLASRVPDLDALKALQGPQTLKCEIRALPDGGTRVVVTNTLAVEIAAGSDFSFTIMAAHGVFLGSFEGPVSAGLAPNARYSEDFGGHIQACSATVQLRQ